MDIEEVSRDLKDHLSPKAIITKYEEMIFVFINNINFEIYDYSLIKAYYDKDYSDEVKEIINGLIDIDPKLIPRYVIETLSSDIYDTSGFTESKEDECEYELDDSFFEEMRSIANRSRKIKIESFGNKYSGFETLCKKYDKTFSALQVNNKIPKGVSLKTERGTNDYIQRVVRSGRGFEYLFRAIVETIEKNNHDTIGVYCRAGHHRSVAVVEMLKKYVYKNADIKHLHIK
jgi:hypothetical protein